MSDQDHVSDRGRLVAGAFAAAVLIVLAGLLVAQLLRQDPGGSAAQPVPAVTAEPTDAAGAAEPTAATEPAPASEPAAATEPPTESPTGDLEPGTTAIFRGEPATGPWQTIGSVREITADGAGPVAADLYTAYWADHGLPPELWDELVGRVSIEAVSLGSPLNRPFLDAAAGSEVYNARGGLRWTNSETRGRGLVVAFDALYERDGLAIWPRWGFIIDPTTHKVVASHRRIEVTEDDAGTLEQASDLLADELWAWVRGRPVLDAE